MLTITLCNNWKGNWRSTSPTFGLPINLKMRKLNWENWETRFPGIRVYPLDDALSEICWPFVLELTNSEQWSEVHCFPLKHLQSYSPPGSRNLECRSHDEKMLALTEFLWNEWTPPPPPPPTPWQIKRLKWNNGKNYSGISAAWKLFTHILHPLPNGKSLLQLIT